MPTLHTDPTPAHDDTGRPRVIVVGAGFAGLNVVKRLKGAPLDVLLIDQHAHHTFQPLLYQVASGQLEAGDVPSRSAPSCAARTTSASVRAS